MNRCWKKRKSSYRSPGGRVRLCSRWTMAEGVFSSVCFFFFCSLFFRFHKSNNTPKRKRWHGAEVRVKGEDVAPLKKALVVVWLVSFLLFFFARDVFSVSVGGGWNDERAAAATRASRLTAGRRLGRTEAARRRLKRREATTRPPLVSVPRE